MGCRVNELALPAARINTVRMFKHQKWEFQLLICIGPALGSKQLNDGRWVMRCKGQLLWI